MEYVRLGNSGLKVSRICLGTMSFGTPGVLFPWCISYEESEAIVKECLDNGINFFDTANIYSNGESEEFLGKALKKYAKREEVVIATKFSGNMNRDAKVNTYGASRKLIFDEVEKSLKRLGTDYIDLYILHSFDENTPVEETMEALNDLVRMGKVRYIGASIMKPWQFAKMQYCAVAYGWSKFISLHNTHNIFHRDDEKELFPMLEDMKVSLTAYKVLSGGRLSRNENDQTERAKTQKLNEIEEEMNARIQKIADAHSCSKADILIAYELSKKPIDVVLVGTTKLGRITDTCKALDIKLSKEEIEELEK